GGTAWGTSGKGPAPCAATRLQARWTKSRTARPWHSTASPGQTWVGETRGTVGDDDHTIRSTSLHDVSGVTGHWWHHSPGPWAGPARRPPPRWPHVLPAGDAGGGRASGGGPRPRGAVPCRPAAGAPAGGHQRSNSWRWRHGVHRAAAR